MSIKLYGMPLSNYYNMVKAILLEKGMEFEEVLVKPNQEADYLARSPMGKVPAMETAQGFLTETGVMIDYLDALGEGPSFYPADPFAKAKVQELIRYLELYIELPGRRLYGDVFFGRPATDAEKAQVKPLLEKGFTALQKLAKFDPYIAGDELTYADFYYLFALAPVTIVCKKTWDWDVRAEIPAIKALNTLLGERESVKRVRADQEQGS
ncbi:MAG: glutathione S-transferase family protein [Proteobacteria bacterium]|nr:glutathione S-transferase family protein [Pseudomonadota bacterium]